MTLCWFCTRISACRMAWHTNGKKRRTSSDIVGDKWAWPTNHNCPWNTYSPRFLTTAPRAPGSAGLLWWTLAAQRRAPKMWSRSPASPSRPFLPAAPRLARLARLALSRWELPWLRPRPRWPWRIPRRRPSRRCGRHRMVRWGWAEVWWSRQSNSLRLRHGFSTEVEEACHVLKATQRQICGFFWILWNLVDAWCL